MTSASLRQCVLMVSVLHGIDVIWPKAVHGVLHRHCQTLHHGLHRQAVGVSGLRQDAHTTIEGDGATGPAIWVRLQPSHDPSVVDVVGVQQGDQDAGVEQGAQLTPPTLRAKPEPSRW